MLSALLISLSACSSHYDSSKKKGVAGYTICQLSQEQAFAVAHNAMETVMPGRKISKIDGPAKGYSTWTRFMLDTYTQRIVIILAKGTTSVGKPVEGFYFQVSGSGSYSGGRRRNRRLFQTIQENLDRMDVAAVVPRIERGSYREPVFATTGRYPGRPPAPPRGATAEKRLQELKRLFEQGLISEKEYNEKREKILQSL